MESAWYGGHCGPPPLPLPPLDPVAPLAPLAPDASFDPAAPDPPWLPLPPPPAGVAGRLLAGVGPELTTNTKLPCVPDWMAAVGITVALGRSRRINRTLTN